MNGWCPTAKIYVGFPNPKEDGFEDINFCGSGLSHLDQARRALGIGLLSLLLLVPKLNILLPVVSN